MKLYVFLKPSKNLLMAFLLVVLNSSFAQAEDGLREREQYYCSLRVARTGSHPPVIDIRRQKLRLRYSDMINTSDGLQPLFLFPNANEDYGLSSLEDMGILARLTRTENAEDPTLEVGFYDARIRYDSSNDFSEEDKMRHPALKSWEFVPIFTVSSKDQSFTGDVSVVLDYFAATRRDVTERDLLGSRIIGNNHYNNIELSCFRDQTFNH